MLSSAKNGQANSTGKKDQLQEKYVFTYIVIPGSHLIWISTVCLMSVLQ